MSDQSDTVIKQKDGKTHVVKVVETTEAVGEKLQAEFPRFSKTLKDHLAKSGIDAEIESATSVKPDANEQSIMTHAIAVVFPSNPNPEQEAFTRGAAHAAMNIAMYEHGYGQNLGIAEVPGAEKGWTTAIQKTPTPSTLAI